MKYAIKFDATNNRWYPIVINKFLFWNIKSYFNEAYRWISWADKFTHEKEPDDGILERHRDHAIRFDSKKDALNFIYYEMEKEKNLKEEQKKKKILSKQNQIIIVDNIL